MIVIIFYLLNRETPLFQCRSKSENKEEKAQKLKVEIPKKKFRKNSSLEEEKYGSISDSKASPYYLKKKESTNKLERIPINTKRVLHRWESQCKPFMQYHINVNSEKTIDELQIAEKMKVILNT